MGLSGKSPEVVVMINCLLSVNGSGLNISQHSRWQSCSFLRIVIDACIIEMPESKFEDALWVAEYGGINSHRD